MQKGSSADSIPGGGANAGYGGGGGMTASTLAVSSFSTNPVAGWRNDNQAPGPEGN